MPVGCFKELFNPQQSSTVNIITWVTVRETKDVAHYSSYIKNLYNLTDTVKESTCFYNTAASKWNKFLMIISSPDEKKKAGGEFQIGLSDLAENRPSKWRVRKICTCLNITSRCYFENIWVETNYSIVCLCIKILFSHRISIFCLWIFLHISRE